MGSGMLPPENPLAPPCGLGRVGRAHGADSYERDRQVLPEQVERAGFLGRVYQDV